MAQQLATMRTPEGYAAVTAYARSHTGDAAAAAYLALGHAYLLDKRYVEAESGLSQARRDDGELGDYADFLAAEAYHEAGTDPAAEAILRGFTDRYPESIFDDEAPELEANVLLAMNNTEGARKVLAAAEETDAVSRPGYQLAEGQVEFALGQQQTAESTFKRLLLAHPLSQEAQTARARLTQMGVESTLTITELRSLGDAYYNAGRYAEAADQFRALAQEPVLDNQTRESFQVSEAACQLKLKRLTPAQVQGLPDTNDENGARRLDLLMELARDRNDSADQQRIVSEMETRFPHSLWLADALFSSGNMYLLQHDYAKAIQYYGELATRFPEDKNAAASHWRSGWLSYRLGQYSDAARIFDEQIRLYPTAAETVSALYWRGRLYETQDRDPARAAANYRTIVRVYQHFFYAQMSRARLSELGATQPASAADLDRFQPLAIPHLVDTFPEDSPHLAKARLLANAGLNEYIAREIKADPDSSSWSALAEAQIYSSYGETFRAVRALKRALPSAASAPIASIPLAYWRILFPEEWWTTIQAESVKNNLDPYLVASLIRQESEFNPSAISNKDAFGLMQLLPSVGRRLAREEGIEHFQTFQLLDPVMNIRLGTRYLRQTLDKFGGVQEYALAAYDAGDNRVTDWQAAGPYSGIDEFVESIPFTETREYVEAILRNEETYKAIDNFARLHGEVEKTASKSGNPALAGQGESPSSTPSHD
ncbi:Lytic transglycosylase catalytic [Candidatus Sulfotelmatomonas gaucii]|uniref:Lytic transglycosylase catalytic n=1 Tax=Candidatus Sulfuritelmatomonas gaucii TaxID=2043161 RepID=A0A2N9LII5_9BACT|nr:Lytic transglycosylase catalytic [Candidatus Sulfotelmatomonas gaucii]